MKKSYLFIISFILFVMLSGCTDYITNKKQDSSGSFNSNLTVNKNAKLRPGGEFIIYNEPKPEMLGTHGVVNACESIEIVDTNAEWVQIKQRYQTGWIPSWFISEEITEPVKDINQKNSVLKCDTSGYLNPEGRAVIDLEKGRLFKPIKEWKNWYQVSILVYNIPAVQVAWVKKECLVNCEILFPKEGYLKTGTKVYAVSNFEEIKQTTSEEIKYDITVFVNIEKNGFIQVQSNGGWSAWTKKENLVFNEDDQLSVVDDFAIQTPNGKIGLMNWDDKVDIKKILENPISEDIQVLGEGADTFKGSTLRTQKYHGLELTLMSSKDNGKTFFVLNMKIIGDKYSTSRDIQIGDEVQKLTKQYPVHQFIEGDKNNGKVKFEDSNTQKSIVFTVENGIINLIEYNYLLQ